MLTIPVKYAQDLRITPAQALYLTDDEFKAKVKKKVDESLGIMNIQYAIELVYKEFLGPELPSVTWDDL